MDAAGPAYATAGKDLSLLQQSCFTQADTDGGRHWLEGSTQDDSWFTGHSLSGNFNTYNKNYVDLGHLTSCHLHSFPNCQTKLCKNKGLNIWPNKQPSSLYYWASADFHTFLQKLLSLILPQKKYVDSLPCWEEVRGRACTFQILPKIYVVKILPCSQMEI